MRNKKRADGICQPHSVHMSNSDPIPAERDAIAGKKCCSRIFTKLNDGFSTRQEPITNGFVNQLIDVGETVVMLEKTTGYIFAIFQRCSKQID
jgi:hypothetical protein